MPKCSQRTGTKTLEVTDHSLGEKKNHFLTMMLFILSVLFNLTTPKIIQHGSSGSGLC